MSITDDLNTLKEERDQRVDAFEFRGLCQEFYRDHLLIYLGQLQVIIDRGNFDTIPASIKTELAQFRVAMLTCQTTIETDVGIQEVLNWG